MQTYSAASTDYDRLLQDELAHVPNERSSTTLRASTRDLYSPDEVLYEPPDTEARSYATISEAVSRLLTSLPPELAFSAIGPALGHHGIGRERWQAEPPHGLANVQGMRGARVESGRTRLLHGLIEALA